MSIRQKSFFDQDHRPKAKSNWQKARSYPDGRPTITESAIKVAPRSPIKASTQTRSKLEAFHFVEGTSGSQEQNKENARVAQRGALSEPENKQGPANETTDTSMEKTPVLAQSKTCPPSTPGMRLPLADLVGNAEELGRRPLPKEQSPEEHIGWIPNSSNSVFTPGQRRKRTVSSSPTTSSQQETSTHLCAKEPLDLQNLQQSLKTPHADPAADLWSRYATGRNADETPLGIKMPNFAHLINDSSPHAVPRTPGGSVNGLRRWQSCGLEWPTSNAKRRRTNGVFRDHQDDVFVDERQAATELPKQTSRVGMLVDKVQETLAQPASRLKHDCPSSSSPFPEKGDLMGGIGVSPLRRRPKTAEADPESRVSSQNGIGPPQRSFSSDEFGDDEIDMDAIDNPNNLGGHPAPVDMTSKGHDEANGQYQENLSHQDQRHVDSVRRLDTIDEDSDEFGDDLDITAEDLENAVPLFDTRSDIPQQPNNSSYNNHGTTEPHLPVVQQPVTNAFARFDLPDELADDSEDEFGGSDLDDEQFAAAEIAATQAYQTCSATQNPVLLVEDENTHLNKAITLRQSWFDTHCTSGNYVHVVGQFTRTGQITINDADNSIIVHPDHLISATTVADSFDCMRKAVLQNRVKATSQTSKPLVYGTVLHEIFQEAMKANRWDDEWLGGVVESIVLKHIELFFELGLTNTNGALEELKGKIPEMRAWASAFVKPKPGPDALVDDRNGSKIKLSITKLLDVEEHVWSPTFGLKGNIDATVEVLMEDEQGERILAVPFEVKTGRNSTNASHRAQTALYTLLLSDRYDVDVVYGVLYYLESSSMTRIPAIRNELRHMVMQRNELASYVRERLQLPPMLQNPFKCGRCYARTSCFLYHKLSEDGTTESAGVKEKFNEIVGKLKPDHHVFFKKWDDLLTKEESELLKFRRELWTMLSYEREKLGRCFSEVIIEPGSAQEQKDAQKINRFTYTLIKKEPAPGFSFTESQITLGEPIVISSEKGHFALANGYITRVSARRISVAVDRRLHNARRKQAGFNSQTSQVFTGIMEVGKEDHQEEIVAATDSVKEEETVYRLDKDEFSNGMATVRNNLLAIMDDCVYRSYELRRLIVENCAPAFKPSPTAYTLSGPASQLQVNADQRAAIDKVMSAQDYALVLGMPGTGKTTTIAHIIRALVANGKSVLLTSYTHTAVDNILLKLREDNISILRLGVLAKIHPEVQAFAGLAAVPKTSIEELEDTYMRPQVVATTCLGITHQLFQRRVFDYCIVDEASQITLPVCLGPIRMARTFVLVGDHYQLPPLVQNREAQEGGLDVSLFKLLSDRQPESVVNLEHQYRMCEDVMLLSNTLIYSGRLKCGNDAVAKRVLRVPDPEGLQRLHVAMPSSHPQLVSTLSNACSSARDATCWLSTLLTPARRVVFANTDTLSPAARETLSGSRITNAVEVTLTTTLVLGLLAQGVPARDIGVITFYRSQLALLRAALKTPHSHACGAGAAAAGEVELHTADKFQGRDKEIIIVSCVRSNEAGNVGDLLKDWRRVNVALTRARSKLIVLGSKATLSHNELLDRFVRLVDEKKWSVDLPSSAAEDHVGVFADMPTQTQRTPAKEGASPARKNRGSPRKVLGEGVGVGNRSPIGKGGKMKSPLKRARMGSKVLVGKTRANPILLDIVNEALGTEFVE